jgi:hypothetical protein
MSLAFLAISMLFISCEKDETKADGEIMFWYNSWGTNATVYLDGESGMVTSYYADYNPDCEAIGCATFTLPEGTYSYTASSSFSTWEGQVLVVKNRCSKILLK